MQQESDKSRNTSSQILPLVIAAFAGATLAIACDRPDSRAVAPEPAPRSEARAPAPAAADPGSRETQVAQAPQSSSIPSRDAFTDTVITGRIKTAILTDPAMAGADVTVGTDHGAVTLVGTVKSHEQTAVASAHAQRQDGVMRVDNHLSVVPQ